MRDFTLHTYNTLLSAIKNKGYKFLTFEKYIKNTIKDRIQNEKVVVLRHDVDRLPKYALNMAKVEENLEIISSYYFRITPNSNNPIIITKIKKIRP